MTVLQVCGISLSLLIFLLQVGRNKGTGGRGVVFAAALMLFSASLEGVAEVFSLFKMQSAGFDADGYKALFKALGIGIVSQFTSELCRDAGEPVLAGRVEFFAKIEIMLLSLPLLRQILALAGEFAA